VTTKAVVLESISVTLRLATEPLNEAIFSDLLQLVDVQMGMGELT